MEREELRSDVLQRASGLFASVRDVSQFDNVMTVGVCSLVGGVVLRFF